MFYSKMSKVLQTCELVAKDADIKIDLNCVKEVANKVSIQADKNLLNLAYILIKPLICVSGLSRNR